MNGSSEHLAERLSDIQNQVRAACVIAGRSVDSIDIVAVSKRQSVSAIREAIESGLVAFGESYAQELVTKMDELSTTFDLQWHFLGHLQSNKARMVVGRCNLIQSVDSDRIAGKIARIAQELGIVQSVLVEVNISGDKSKSGISQGEALALCETVFGLKSLRLAGLMGIAPRSTRSEPSLARASFADLRTLFEDLPAESRQILSMGMSGDFAEAIAEGSTMLRIGTALFGPRA